MPQDRDGESDYVIGSDSIQYGLAELSKIKRDTYLKAEFPHSGPAISKLRGGKTFQYDEKALKRVLGTVSQDDIDDLVGIGLFHRSGGDGETTYKVPFLYRDGLELTQGRSG